MVSLDGVTALLDDEVALPLGQVLEAFHLPLHATAFRLERGLQRHPITMINDELANQNCPKVNQPIKSSKIKK